MIARVFFVLESLGSLCLSLAFGTAITLVWDPGEFSLEVWDLAPRSKQFLNLDQRLTLAGLDIGSRTSMVLACS